MTITRTQRAETAKSEYEHKVDLINKAKAEYARLKNPPAAQGGGIYIHLTRPDLDWSPLAEMRASANADMRQIQWFQILWIPNLIWTHTLPTWPSRTRNGEKSIGSGERACLCLFFPSLFGKAMVGLAEGWVGNRDGEENRSACVGGWAWV